MSRRRTNHVLLWLCLQEAVEQPPLFIACAAVLSCCRQEAEGKPPSYNDALHAWMSPFFRTMPYTITSCMQHTPMDLMHAAHLMDLMRAAHP